MTKKIHVIADESLGGIKREYVEVVVPPKVTEHTARSAGVYFEPTNIVHMDGTRYKLVDRKANVGERVLVKKDASSTCESNHGKIFKVTFEDVRDLVDVDGTHGDGSPLNLFTKDYYVLEPVESEPSPQSTDDIIANLARRVAELERSQGVIKRDIETWAQEIEELKHANKPKQITLDVEVLARLLGGAARD